MSERKVDLLLAASSASMVLTLLVLGYGIYSVQQYEKAALSIRERADPYISEALKKTRSVCNILHSAYQTADTPQKRLRLSLNIQRKGGKELPKLLSQSIQRLVSFSTRQPQEFWSFEAEWLIYFCEQVRVLK